MSHPPPEHLHPRHPGVGKPLHIIEAEGLKPEQGGFFAFLPSGHTKTVAWSSVRPITPTFDAAKQFAARLIEDLQKSDLQRDIDAINWASATAAIQRVILDFNDRIKLAINDRMAAAHPIVLPPKNVRLH